MRILIDVDGVCADFTNYALKSIGFEGFTVTEWNFVDHLPPAKKKELYALLESPLWWRVQPVNGLAQGAIKLLRAHGCEIRFVTSPWVSCVGWESARRDWLKEHFESKADELITTNAKHCVVGDVFVDDKPSHVQSWQEDHHSGYAILYSQEYNEDIMPRMRKTWPSIVEFVQYLQERREVIEW